ncbi:zinc finger, C2H2 type [Necator americanus]|uniref:Zinc finger, C2H2 type n=1 Tax=Necator americanus TaxID=51031 RepID=W2TC49_NECAM|nr:zinc finger, C2H2 type [Necator americanus]ETN79403.1 zinc finger, C2H2 type [Necator americanus]
MDPFQWQQYPQSGASSSVSGTSELFSSTYAMLSDTASAPYPDQWHENKSDCESTFYFDAVPGPYGHPSNNMYYPVHDPRFQSTFTDAYPRAAPQQYDNHVQVPVSESIQITANYPTHFPPHQHTQKLDYPQSAALALTPSIAQPPTQTALSTAPLPRPSTVSPCEQTALSSPTLTSNSGSAASETPPISGEIISTELEGPDNERVMCMACRGVYPSRRSLTGHIGRNEKCREIIGRNYLDQVAMGGNPIAPGTENAIKAGALTNGQDGLSPICPHCDRFISHYKGNIRRHINQCGKNESPQKRPRPDKDKRRDGKKRRQEETLLPHVLHEGFDPASNGHNAPLVASPVMSPPMGSYHSVHEQEFTDNSIYMNGHSLEQQIQLPSDPSPPGAPRKEADPPEDAYICDSCEFVTIYKGNMKRHLNTCHPAPDCKDLKEWDRKLESMRASVLGMSRVEMIERLNAHRMNSTRGRKPRGKKSEESAQVF